MESKLKALDGTVKLGTVREILIFSQ